jgi:hypothetical protein
MKYIIKDDYTFLVEAPHAWDFGAILSELRIAHTITTATYDKDGIILLERVSISHNYALDDVIAAWELFLEVFGNRCFNAKGE